MQNQIFQQFDLRLTREALNVVYHRQPDIGKAQMPLEQFLKLKDSLDHLPERLETLHLTLDNKGYLILMSQENVEGIPSSILVGGSVNQNIKGDFAQIAEQFGFPYISGRCYIPGFALTVDFSDHL